MQKQDCQETMLVQRIEPDWAESEWFQVWLELARLPHQTPIEEEHPEALPNTQNH